MIDKPEYLCFGVGDEGVFFTPNNLGTKFHPSRYTEHNCIISSNPLVSAIFERFGKKIIPGENIYMDFNVQQVDEDVFKLVPVNKKGWL